MTVTAPQGFRAAGVAAGIKDGGRPDLALVVNDGPGHGRRRHVHHQPGQGRARAVVAAGADAAVALRAVVLNSGGANACTGPGGLPGPRTRPPRRPPRSSALRPARRDRRLLHRHHRRAAARRQAARGRRARPRPSSPAHLRGGHRRRLRRCSPPTPCQTGARAPRPAGPSAASPRARACSPRRWPRCSCVLTTDAVADAATCDAALRAAVAPRSTGSTSTAARRRTTPCCCSRPAPRGVTPGAGSSRPPSAAPAPTCAGSCRPMPRASPSTSRSPCAVPARRPTRWPSPARWRRTTSCKTAFFGADPNWGRIAMAVGRAPGKVDPQRLGITINGVPMCRDGVAAGIGTPPTCLASTSPWRSRSGSGDGSAEILTTDLSHAYVEENSAYSS